jgi:hypothetical protein
MIPAVQSIYRWQGQVDTPGAATETLLLLKTGPDQPPPRPRSPPPPAAQLPDPGIPRPRPSKPPASLPIRLAQLAAFRPGCLPRPKAPEGAAMRWLMIGLLVSLAALLFAAAGVARHIWIRRSKATAQAARLESPQSRPGQVFDPAEISTWN